PDWGRRKQPPGGEGVGDRAADDGEREERDGVRERDQPHGELRAGELVHLVRERDLGDLGADEGDALAEPEPAEGGVPPQRRQVEREARQEAAALRGGDPWLVCQKSLFPS